MSLEYHVFIVCSMYCVCLFGSLGSLIKVGSLLSSYNFLDIFSIFLGATSAGATGGEL